MTKEQKFEQLRKLINNMPLRPEVITAQQMFDYYDEANRVLKIMAKADNSLLAQLVLDKLSEED